MINSALIRQWFVFGLELLVSPISLIARLVATILMVALAIVIPGAFGWILVQLLGTILADLNQWIADLVGHQQLIKIVAIITSIGLISTISLKCLNRARCHARTTWSIVKGFRYFLTSETLNIGLNFKRSIKKTIRRYLVVPVCAIPAYIGWQIYLIVPLLELCVIGAIASYSFTDNTPRTIVILDLPAANDSPQVSRQDHDLTLDKFENADLHSLNGVCPSEEQLRSLRILRSILAQYEESNGLRIAIQGFASIAPVLSSSDDNSQPKTSENSDSLNCQIANYRALAVARFLTASPTTDSATSGTTDWLDQCKEQDLLSDGTQPCTKCSGDCQPHEFRYDHSGSNSFGVIYVPWDTHSAMDGAKPADDGSPSSRLRQYESANRAVRITLRGVPSDLVMLLEEEFEGGRLLTEPTLQRSDGE